MTSVETSRAAPSPQRPTVETPQNRAPRAADRSAPQGFAPPRPDLATTDHRQSPDPLCQTDRYRLNMPYLDRID